MKLIYLNIHEKYFIHSNTLLGRIKGLIFYEDVSELLKLLKVSEIKWEPYELPADELIEIIGEFELDEINEKFPEYLI